MNVKENAKEVNQSIGIPENEQNMIKNSLHSCRMQLAGLGKTNLVLSVLNSLLIDVCKQFGEKHKKGPEQGAIEYSKLLHEGTVDHFNRKAKLKKKLKKKESKVEVVSETYGENKTVEEDLI